MRMTEIFEKRPALSFEVFPPKTDEGFRKLCGDNGVLHRLYELYPDYISCTYGAGGANIGRNLEVLNCIAADGKTLPMTHFTCVGNTKENIKKQLGTYLSHNIRHVLALRGDLPLGWEGTHGDFQYATELVRYIRENFGDAFTIAVSGSPEGHIEAESIEKDISFLKQKQEEGADYIMTQLCWDMDQFRRWMDQIRAAGITMPVDVGVMPVLDQRAIIRMSLNRNGCAMPRELCKLISKYWIFPDPFTQDPDDREAAMKKRAFQQEGMEFTVRQIEEYRKCGIAGIHLYTLNKHDAVAHIAAEAGLIPKKEAESRSSDAMN